MSASNSTWKRLVIALVLIAGVCVPLTCFGYEGEEHNAQIEFVLFGNRDYKKTHPNDQAKIESIESAVYLCVDQFNGRGQDELDYLIAREIPNLPKSIDTINFSGNYAHRGPTHNGWNGEHAKKCNWPARKAILLETVRAELFSSTATPLWWFPWLEGVVFGVEDEYRVSYDKQCEGFCMLLYNVHVLGDVIHAGDGDRNTDGELTLKQKLNGLAYVNSLSRPNDTGNPGIIPDLRKCLSDVFKDKEDSLTYNRLINKLADYEAISDKLVSSKGGIDSEEEFEEYCQCAKSLLGTLGEYVPGLLMKEVFFKEAFYQRKL